jgi:hypothetical protein
LHCVFNHSFKVKLTFKFVFIPNIWYGASARNSANFISILFFYNYLISFIIDINECGFSFITTKELSSIDTEKEIWFGGKSIAVSEIILEEVIQILNLS